MTYVSPEVPKITAQNILEIYFYIKKQRLTLEILQQTNDSKPDKVIADLVDAYAKYCTNVYTDAQYFANTAQYVYNFYCVTANRVSVEQLQFCMTLTQLAKKYIASHSAAYQRINSFIIELQKLGLLGENVNVLAFDIISDLIYTQLALSRSLKRDDHAKIIFNYLKLAQLCSKAGLVASALTYIKTAQEIYSTQNANIYKKYWEQKLLRRQQNKDIATSQPVWNHGSISSEFNLNAFSGIVEDKPTMFAEQNLEHEKLIHEIKQSLFRLLNAKYGAYHEQDIFIGNRVIIIEDFESILLYDTADAIFTKTLELFSDEKETIKKEKLIFAQYVERVKVFLSLIEIRLSVYLAITQFCFFLIETRARALEIFEQFDQYLYELINKYEFISDKKNILTPFISSEALNSPEQFLQFIEHIKNHQMFVNDEQELIYENLKFALNDHFSNHSSYIHNHLANVRQLIQSVFAKIVYHEKIMPDARKILEIRGTSVLLSEVNEIIKIYGEQLKEIQVIASHAIYFDSNELVAPGVNLVFIAPVLDVVGSNRAYCTLVTNALALSFPTLPKALSGLDGNYKYKDGIPGQNGENGLYGGAAGNIFLVAEKIKRDQFLFDSKGAAGQDGQSAGNGGKGYDGTDGVDATCEQDNLYFHKWVSYIHYAHGKHGEPGGKGGDAGFSGAGGLGGSGGKFEAIDLNSDIGQDLDFEQQGPSGPDGKTGDQVEKPGIRGTGGYFGLNGKDHYHWKDWNLNLFGKPKDENFYGLLSHPEIKRTTASGTTRHQWFNTYAKPKQLQLPDSAFFKKSSRNAEAGVNPGVRDNHKLRLTNSAIDKKDSLEIVNNYFNSINKAWNSVQLNSFLRKFAERLKLIDSEYGVDYVSRSAQIRNNAEQWRENINIAIETITSNITRTKQLNTTRSTHYVERELEFKAKSGNDSVVYLNLGTDLLITDIDPTQLVNKLILRGLVDDNHIEKLEEHLSLLDEQTALFCRSKMRIANKLKATGNLNAFASQIVGCNGPSAAEQLQEIQQYLDNSGLLFKDFVPVEWRVKLREHDLEQKCEDFLESLNEVNATLDPENLVEVLFEFAEALATDELIELYAKDLTLAELVDDLFESMLQNINLFATYFKNNKTQYESIQTKLPDCWLVDEIKEICIEFNIKYHNDSPTEDCKITTATALLAIQPKSFAILIKAFTALRNNFYGNNKQNLLYTYAELKKTITDTCKCAFLALRSGNLEYAEVQQLHDILAIFFKNKSENGELIALYKVTVIFLKYFEQTQINTSVDLLETLLGIINFYDKISIDNKTLETLKITNEQLNDEGSLDEISRISDSIQPHSLALGTLISLDKSLEDLLNKMRQSSIGQLLERVIEKLEKLQTAVKLSRKIAGFNKIFVQAYITTNICQDFAGYFEISNAFELASTEMTLAITPNLSSFITKLLSLDFPLEKYFSSDLVDLKKILSNHLVDLLSQEAEKLHESISISFAVNEGDATLTLNTQVFKLQEDICIFVIDPNFGSVFLKREVFFENLREDSKLVRHTLDEIIEAEKLNKIVIVYAQKGKLIRQLADHLKLDGTRSLFYIKYREYEENVDELDIHFLGNLFSKSPIDINHHYQSLVNLLQPAKEYYPLAIKTLTKVLQSKLQSSLIEIDALPFIVTKQTLQNLAASLRFPALSSADLGNATDATINDYGFLFYCDNKSIFTNLLKAQKLQGDNRHLKLIIYLFNNYKNPAWQPILAAVERDYFTPEKIGIVQNLLEFILEQQESNPVNFPYDLGKCERIFSGVQLLKLNNADLSGMVGRFYEHYRTGLKFAKVFNELKLLQSTNDATYLHMHQFNISKSNKVFKFYNKFLEKNSGANGKQMIYAGCLNLIELNISSLQQIQNINNDKDYHFIGMVYQHLINSAEKAINDGAFESLDAQLQIYNAISVITNEASHKRSFDFSPREICDLWGAVSTCVNPTYAVDVIKNFTPKTWFRELIIYNFSYCINKCFPDADFMQFLCIRSTLKELDPKLLKHLYYRFIIEHHNQAIDNDDLIPTYQLLQFEEILTLVEIVKHLKIDQMVLYELSQHSIKNWLPVVTEIHFAQIFKEWTMLDVTNFDYFKFLLNAVRMELGPSKHDVFIGFLSNFIQKINEPSLQHNARNLLTELYYQQINFEQAIDIVNNCEVAKWTAEVNEKSIKNFSNQQARTFDDLIAEISKNFAIDVEYMQNITRDLIDDIKMVQRHIANGDVEEKENIKQTLKVLQLKLDLGEKQLWLRKPQNMHDVLIAISVALWLNTELRSDPEKTVKETQLMSIILFMITDDSNMLQQIETGEGKTYVVAMLATLKALLGYRVDVISSNRDLANDGLDKSRELYNFFELKAAVNCKPKLNDADTEQSQELDLKVARQAYNGNIVYGDIQSYQGHILHDKLNPDFRMLGGRYSKFPCCLIVDEADSMFLDKLRQILYLSHQSPALKHLETLLLLIWSAILSIKTDTNDENPLINTLQTMADDINILIDQKSVPLPEYLHVYAKDKMFRWVKSAYIARFLETEESFVLRATTDISTMPAKARELVIIDRDTGTEEYSSRWGNALTTFLEFRFRRKVNPENLKADFISNLEFFRRYMWRHADNQADSKPKQILGMTGTLGSAESRKTLSNLFDLNLVDMPTYYKKKFIRVPSEVAGTRGNWVEQIIIAINTRYTNQPILIICETIKDSHYIKANIEKQFKDLLESNEIKLHMYCKDGDDVEKIFAGAEKAARKGDIIIATNKGGRGTDINVFKDSSYSLENRANAGLHVIVAYLPSNSRILKQAFGRTSRNDQFGTGQLIVYIHNLKRYGNQHPEVIIEQEKAIVHQKELQHMNQLLSRGIPQLEVEQELYAKYWACLAQFKDIIKHTSFMDEVLPDDVQKGLLEILKDKWSFYLSDVERDIKQVSSMELKKDLLQKFDRNFVQQNLSDVNNLDKFLEKPEYLVDVAFHFYKLKKYAPSFRLFELAAKRGDITGIAVLGATVAYICPNPMVTVENKRKVRNYLKTARINLDEFSQAMIANAGGLEIVNELVTLNEVAANENLYSKQVNERVQILQLHLRQIANFLGTQLDYGSFVHLSKINGVSIDEARSKNIYEKLVEQGFLYHDKIASRWLKPENQAELASLLKSHVDRGLIDPVHHLIQCNAFSKEKLDSIVYSSDELWQILSSNRLITNSEEVLLLTLPIEADRKHIEEIQLYLKFIETFSLRIPENAKNFELGLPCGSEAFAGLQSAEYAKLYEYLLKQGNATLTIRAKIDNNYKLSVSLLGRYAACKVRDQNHKLCTIEEFLQSLFEYSLKTDGYLYQSKLPYAQKEKESAKIYNFFYEKHILKSGGLLRYRYDSNKDALHAATENLLNELCKGKKNDGSHKTAKDIKEEVEYLQRVLNQLQGTVREFDHQFKAGFIDFKDLKDRPNAFPDELHYFVNLHLHQFIEIIGVPHWFNLGAFIVILLGVAQLIAGICLMCLTAGIMAQVGMTLMFEGVMDIFYASMAWHRGNFSWRQYGIQKTISLLLAGATLGFSYLIAVQKAAEAAKTAKAAQGVLIAEEVVAESANLAGRIGEGASLVAQKSADVGSQIGQMIGEMAIGFITDTVVDQAVNLILDSTVDLVEATMLKNLEAELKYALHHLESQNDKHEFKQAVNELRNTLGRQLQHSGVLSHEMDVIRAQLLSGVETTFRSLARTSGPGNEVTKALSETARAIALSNEVFNVVKNLIDVAKAGNEASRIIRRAASLNVNQAPEQVNLSPEAQKEFDGVKEVIRSYVKNNISAILRSLLNRVAKEGVNMVNVALSSNIEKNRKNALAKSKEALKQLGSDTTITREMPQIELDLEMEKIDKLDTPPLLKVDIDDGTLLEGLPSIKAEPERKTLDITKIDGGHTLEELHELSTNVPKNLRKHVTITSQHKDSKASARDRLLNEKRNIHIMHYQYLMQRQKLEKENKTQENQNNLTGEVKVELERKLERADEPRVVARHVFGEQRMDRVPTETNTGDNRQIIPQFNNVLIRNFRSLSKNNFTSDLRKITPQFQVNDNQWLPSIPNRLMCGFASMVLVTNAAIMKPEIFYPNGVIPDTMQIFTEFYLNHLEMDAARLTSFMLANKNGILSFDAYTIELIQKHCAQALKAAFVDFMRQDESTVSEFYRLWNIAALPVIWHSNELADYNDYIIDYIARNRQLAEDVYDAYKEHVDVKMNSYKLTEEDKIYALKDGISEEQWLIKYKNNEYKKSEEFTKFLLACSTTKLHFYDFIRGAKNYYCNKVIESSYQARETDLGYIARIIGLKAISIKNMHSADVEENCENNGLIKIRVRNINQHWEAAVWPDFPLFLALPEQNANMSGYGTLNGPLNFTAADVQREIKAVTPSYRS